MLLIKSVLYLKESKVKEPYHLMSGGRRGAGTREIDSSNNYNETIILILIIGIIVMINYIFVTT